MIKSNRACKDALEFYNAASLDAPIEAVQCYYEWRFKRSLVAEDTPPLLKLK
jgi:hypothetical protein